MRETESLDFKLDTKANLNVKKISTNYPLLQSNELIFKIWKPLSWMEGISYKFSLVIAVITRAGAAGEG